MKHDKPRTIWAHLMIMLLILSLNIFGQQCFAQHSASYSNRFLIILDVQEYYTQDKMLESSAQHLISSINEVIEKTESNQIIYVTMVHQVLNLSFSSPFIFTSLDTLAMQQDNRLIIVNEQIFQREKSDAFSCEIFTDFLEQNHATELIIAGLRAEEFLYQSLISGKELGYEMYMIPEAMAGKSQKRKDKAIDKLQKKGIKLLVKPSLIHE